MGISSFQFSEDYPAFSVQDSTPSTNLSLPSVKKRSSRDNSCDFNHESSAQEFLSKLLAFDNQLESNPLEQQHLTISEISNYNQTNREMKSEYQHHFSNSPPNLVNTDNSSNTKRARSDINSVATTPEDSTKAINGSCSHRRLWVKNRSKAWWEQVNSPNFPEEDFKNAFRMSRATFNLICQELESVVTKKDTALRLAIPVPQRVAVCIWRLATGEALREVSKRFGLGISTCHKLILEVCTAIKTVLMPKFLQWPDESRMREVKMDFETLSGIPDVGGSMYTTHVPIIAPKINVGAYFNKRHTQRNQKTSYSITVQGVVDSKGVFTDVCIGWPGSMTDDQVLEKSSLFERVNSGDLKDVSVVGSSGYPLMDFALVPYTHQNLTWTQHAYNEKIQEVQKVAKEAFMRLKARWSCLQKRTEMKLQDLPVVLGACCVLHNMCEMNNDGFSEELRFELFDDEMIPENSMMSVNAMNTRDQIAHKLLHHNQAGTRFV